MVRSGKPLGLGKLVDAVGVVAKQFVGHTALDVILSLGLRIAVNIEMQNNVGHDGRIGHTVTLGASAIILVGIVIYAVGVVIIAQILNLGTEVARPHITIDLLLRLDIYIGIELVVIVITLTEAILHTRQRDAHTLALGFDLLQLTEHRLT